MRKSIILLKYVFFAVMIGSSILYFISCQKSGDSQMKIKKDIFGSLKNGTEVYLYTISNDKGSQIQITDYGATLVSAKVPDKNGKIEHVVLGFDRIEDYENLRIFYGSTTGRYANRIAKGKFTLNGVEYTLATNDGENHLHGGIMGFDRVVWNSEQIMIDNLPAIKFSYLSKDGEEGYPGNLSVTVIYTFSRENALKIYYEMTSDKPTIKNVTNHAYFNLSGDLKHSILEHQLMLNADQFLPVGKGLIPTGEFRNVKGTPLDFTKPYKVGERINEDYQQLTFGGGYDHNYIINRNEDGLNYVGYVYEAKSGRRMDVYTSEPGVQLYTGNFMNGSHSGREGLPYKKRHALCLETQHYPDSPNQDHFPKTVLDPGEVYQSTTIYKFSVKVL